ncbi:MAG: glycosyltransferase family 2 protein [Chloroflexi bacterium]|nr:glycosyltransferase family 2 protein [Chloroflexota bacterium]
MTTITGAVICKNEERHLPDCLASLDWVDELLVVDSYSTDWSVAIACRFTARVHQRRFENYSKQRNAALDLAGGEWVLFVDADERVGVPLAEEIRRVLAHGDPHPPFWWGESGGQGTGERAGYWIPRRNVIFGRWIRHAGWYPDYQLRLLRRESARFDEAQPVHEVAAVRGTTGRLTEPLVHINYERLGEFIAKQSHYAEFEAQSLERRGIRPKARSFITQPTREFLRRYVTLAGYKDGAHGLLLSSLMAAFTLVTYVKLARGRSAVGSRQSAVGSRRSAVGGRESAVGTSSCGSEGRHE